MKSSPDDNTSYGHNAESAWLMMYVLDILGISIDTDIEKIKAMLDHAIDIGNANRLHAQYAQRLFEGLKQVLPSAAGLFQLQFCN